MQVWAIKNHKGYLSEWDTFGSLVDALLYKTKTKATKGMVKDGKPKEWLVKIEIKETK